MVHMAVSLLCHRLLAVVLLRFHTSVHVEVTLRCNESTVDSRRPTLSFGVSLVFPGYVVACRLFIPD